MFLFLHHYIMICGKKMREMSRINVVPMERSDGILGKKKN